MIAMNDESLVFEKLSRMLGADKANALIREVCAEIGLEQLSCATDRHRFGTALLSRGGLHNALGRAINIQAILHGADA